MGRIPAPQRSRAKSKKITVNQTSNRTKIVWLCLVLAALVAVTFLPCLNNGFVTYDDPDYVTKNVRVQSGISLSGIQWALTTGSVSSNWHPLTLLSHMLDCEWFGLQPFGHHLTSYILHILNSVLLFVMLQRMTGFVWCSFAVAAWFGLHPAHVESVAWVAERKDVLSGLFWMLTLLAYAEFARTPTGGSRRRTYYLFSLGSFFLGLLAKPMLVTLPFVLLLLDYWPLRRLSLENVRRLVAEKVPFFVLTLVSTIVTYIVQKHGGAMALVEPVPLSDRLTNALVAYGRYVQKLLWPTDLAVFYPFRNAWPMFSIALAALFVMGVSAITLLHARKHRFLPVGWFWFLGTLVPVIGLVQVGAQSMADRYTYLPSIGLFVVVAWGVNELAQRMRYPSWATGTIGFATVAACIVATRTQITFWKDGETLFRRAVAVSGDHYLPHLSLGIALLGKGRFSEALVSLQQSRVLRPAEFLVHNNLGAAFLAEGRLNEATVAFQKALSSKPDSSMAMINLAQCYISTGQFPSAADILRKAIIISPDNAQAHFLLGVALLSERRHDDALMSLNRALELQPAFAQARQELTKALVFKGQLEEARNEWRRTVDLVAGSATEHNSFGVLLAEAGQFEAAIKEFEEAQRVEPGNADARNNLSRARAAKAGAANSTNRSK